MSAVTASVEIDRSPDEVFAYAVDPAHLAEWQENVMTAAAEGAARRRDPGRDRPASGAP